MDRGEGGRRYGGSGGVGCVRCGRWQGEVVVEAVEEGGEVVVEVALVEWVRIVG